MENKNTIIALVLMLAVWLGYSFLFPAASPVSEPAPVAGSAPAAAPAAVAPTTAAAEAGDEYPVTVTPSAPAQTIQVENDRFKAVFTTAGGRLVSLELKDYRETPAANSGPVILHPAGPLRQAAFRSGGSDGFQIAEDANFQLQNPDDQAIQLKGSGEQSLTLTHVSPNGLQIDKIYTFKGNSYGFDLKVVYLNHSAAPISGTSSLSLVSPWDEEHAGSSTDHVGPTTYVEEKLHTDKVKNLDKEPASYGSGVVWSAFENKYFIAIVAPLQGSAEKTNISLSGGQVENTFQSPYFTLQPGGSKTDNYRIYYGPKDVDILRSVDPSFAKAVDFGFFSLLATPLLHVLKFIYGFVGNYGIAIIIVTIVIKLLFWPLTQKSYSSMKAMQKLQPEMAKIRERCKNDREKLNREVMELYKKNRVNPMGGCLPMVVQIPVFFALYKVLMNTIDLRHAHFAFWITDLAAKDPYYITPLIMGATMFIQQKMSPSTMDPVQAKVFMLMPVIFTFLFLNFPSGLVVYWLVNNLLTILQQYFINKKA